MPLTETLKTIVGALRRRRLFASVSKALSCLSLFFLLLNIVNAIVPLTESFCAIVGYLAIACAVVYLAKNVLSPKNRLSVQTLALEMEKAHPEFMDSFICAVELETKAESAPLRPLEVDLLDDVRRRVHDASIVEETFKKSLNPFPVILYGFLAVCLTIAAVHAPATHKWFHANRNPFTFTKATLDEYPRHGDIQLVVHANRWEQDLWIEIIDADGSKQHHPMHPMNDENASAFVFYDVRQPVRYRVGSPSLRSKWFSFSVFDPPEITSLSITVTPPAYTGAKVATFTELQDFSIIEGSVVNIELKTSVKATQVIERKNHKEELDIRSFMLKETDDLRIVLTDDHGRQQMTPWFHVSVEPDLLPVLEQRQPTSDIKIKSFDFVRLDASASDDFGLQSFGLQFTKNGTERQTVLFHEHKDGTPRETTWDHNAQWNVPALKLQDGDMLSCFFFVEDNREPNHQMVRGEVFFITVQPDEDEIEADGNGGGDSQKTSVADLIAESKRLLRLTWDTLSLPSQSRERQTDELQRGLVDLQLEIVRRENKLKEELMKLVIPEKQEGDDETPSEDEPNYSHLSLPEPFNSLFQAAEKAEDASVRLVKDRLLDESSVTQERALTSLVKIENELLRNAMKSKKGEEGQNGKGEQKPQDKKQDSADKKENEQNRQQQAEVSKQLEEAAELLRRQIVKQEAINASASSQDAVATGLADKQVQLGQDTAALEKMLRPLQEAASAREAIAQAAAEMQHGANAFQRNDIRTGAIHGNRAHTAQLDALQSLEDAIQAATAKQLQKLGEKARELSGRQNDAAGQSADFQQQQSVPQEAAKEARQRQQQLKDETEQLRKSLQETAEQFDEKHPDIARALRESIRNMDERKILAAQQRAANALLYRRFDRAEKEQTDASNLLSALAMELDSASEMLPKMTAQELREALEKIQEQARQTAQNMNGEGQQATDRLNQLRQQAEQNLQKLGEKLKDNRLNQLSDNMSLPFNGETPSEAGQTILRNLQTASQILAEHLEKLTMEKRHELSRSQLAPPLKYRRQVEDYFKQMSK
ncbi:MAG: hypothetical protein K5787_16765 [Lentisphaeria bacterium]|nr:hypothetical protein [Lentisphaeria bacterium]